MIYAIDGRIKNKAVLDFYIPALIKALGLNRLSKPLVEIEFKNKVSAYGYCEGDRDYVKITIAKKCPVTGRKLGFIEMMQTLAHEMVHARQFLRGELVAEGVWKWKGRNGADYKYENQPWEKEAYRLEKVLFQDCFPFHIKFTN